MEQENLDQEVSIKKNLMDQVTPLSKYAAMILFIMLPFVGGYIGYNLAIIQVSDVEHITTKVVDTEKDSVANDKQDTLVSDERQSAIWQIEQYFNQISINNEVFSSSTGAYRLSYDNDAFFVDKQKVFTTASSTFEIYRPHGLTLPFHYLRLDKKIYGMRFMGVSSVELLELEEADADSFELLGYGYASDGVNIFYVTSSEALRVDSNDGKLEFVSIEAGAEPLLIAGNKVFHRGEYLEGLKYPDMIIGIDISKPKGYYLKDGNAVFLLKTDCHYGSYYKVGSESDIEKWIPGC